jgi:hypothetical protein
MAARRKFSADITEQILHDFCSDMSGVDVGKKYGCDYFRTIRRVWLTKYTKQDIDRRFKRLCAIRKLGKLNPMSGRSKELHHRYKPVHYREHGYRWVDCPSWYTGVTDKGKIAEHILVACEAAGITELPMYHVVHHKDERKDNNVPENLEIISRGRHMVIHRWLRHNKKVQRLSRKGVGPK